MANVSFEEFIGGLRVLGSADSDTKALTQLVREAGETAAAILALNVIDRASLSGLIATHPHCVPFLATCIGLGREQLLRQLQHRLGTSGWVTLARKQPALLVETLDEAFGLVQAIQEQRAQSWTFADVLVERARWSQRSASKSVTRGRRLEDAVEQVVNGLGLKYEMRKSFVGQGNESAPSDFAIPAAGHAALIVGAVKGFDSTGSKLSDAVREIQRMAQVRLPMQFVFAFLDGIGWLGRQADLKRIYDLAVTRRIDGLYSLCRVDSFKQDLAAAARRVGLIG